MPTPKNEMVLNVDGILPVDPALGLRAQAHSLIAARQWTTPDVFYGDQPEPAYSNQPKWSMCFCLGLDHVPATKADWFADVSAILEFMQRVARDTDSQFLAEFRLSSRLSYSEHIVFVDDETIDLSFVRAVIERLTRRNRSDDDRAA